APCWSWSAAAVEWSSSCCRRGRSPPARTHRSSSGTPRRRRCRLVAACRISPRALCYTSYFPRRPCGRRVPPPPRPPATSPPRSRPAAGRLRRAAHDDLGALLPQGAVRHRLVGDGRHATHVIAVAGRARTVAGLIGGGATGRDGLLVARHRAAGRARTLVSAV